MFARVVLAMALLTAACLAFLLPEEAAPPPPAREPAGPPPALGRGTLDHAGQPAALLPGEERVAVTGEVPR